LRSLRQARTAHRTTKREFAHLQSAITALLSLHNTSAAESKMDVTLSLGPDRPAVSLVVDQTPDRGVGGLLWQSSTVLAESLSVLLKDLIKSSAETASRHGHGAGGVAGGEADASASASARPVVIELGAGVAALPSLAAATLLAVSAATVIATDTPDIVAIMRGSVSKHLAAVSAAPGSVVVSACTWEDSSSASCPISSSSSSSTSTNTNTNTNTSCDGADNHTEVERTPPLPPADVLMGADILYVERCHEALIRTISSLLKPGGLLLLTYAERSPASEQSFFTSLHKQTGIVCTRCQEPCVRDGQTVFTVQGRRPLFGGGVTHEGGGGATDQDKEKEEDGHELQGANVSSIPADVKGDTVVTITALEEEEEEEEAPSLIGIYI
jgi:hypothetical protein